MFRVATGLLALFVLVAGTTGSTADGNSKFIATVHEGHDPHAVAKRIADHGADAEQQWVGSVERTHAAIRVLIVNGPRDTCDVLQKIDGIKQCEEDSIVSIHD